MVGNRMFASEQEEDNIVNPAESATFIKRMFHSYSYVASLYCKFVAL